MGEQGVSTSAAAIERMRARWEDAAELLPR